MNLYTFENAIKSALISIEITAEFFEGAKMQ